MKNHRASGRPAPDSSAAADFHAEPASDFRATHPARARSDERTLAPQKPPPCYVCYSQAAKREKPKAFELDK